MWEGRLVIREFTNTRPSSIIGSPHDPISRYGISELSTEYVHTKSNDPRDPHCTQQKIRTTQYTIYQNNCNCYAEVHYATYIHGSYTGIYIHHICTYVHKMTCILDIHTYLNILNSSSISESPWNNGFFVTISAMMQAILHTSIG